MTTITLLHGIGGASWSPVLPALAPATVLDWPLPGYGGSPMLAGPCIDTRKMNLST